ncbi:molybdopterin-binding protein [Nostocaceae cyanobacterium CENA369]|jgi:molybdopterin-binding protein|uniref:Molybdopterin-binding protein n=1 Tax=Dendronalium phyllosphericum CENA369 TaxID=1725256 RepID=A0A8J7LKS9_9NOST|nr:molybdopterin-binding protein [Dendronalium phyllosphericum]MBH8576249.1 molybdopterin-binding protein [Dendronalium phyllosphericum CENA369]
MDISARNCLKGIVKNILPGSVNTEVILEIMPDVEVTAIITKSSAQKLQLAIGKEAYVVIKASDVIVAID